MFLFMIVNRGTVMLSSLNNSPGTYTSRDATPSHDLWLQTLSIWYLGLLIISVRGLFSIIIKWIALKCVNKDHDWLLLGKHYSQCIVVSTLAYCLIQLQYLFIMQCLCVSFSLFLKQAETRRSKNMKSTLWSWLALLSPRPWKAHVKS